MTGERASIDSSATLGPATDAVDTTVSTPGTVGPATAEALADLLGRAASGPETATYEIRPTGGTATTEAIVSRDTTRIVVSIRDVQYRSDATGPRTCRRSTGTCTQGFNSQPLSDLNVTAQFWGPSVRQELRSPTLAARIGPIRTTETAIAEEPARCVDVPGPQLTDRYCALTTGLLAQKTTARVEIVLTSYDPTFDEALWAEYENG
jgi:hypothetical protein